MSDRPIDDRGVPTAMGSRELVDRALSREEPIEPSLGFRTRVMRQVRAEASLPPLRFPWWRFAGGVALAMVALGGVAASGDALDDLSFNLALIIPAAVLLILAARLTVGRRSPATS